MGDNGSASTRSPEYRYVGDDSDSVAEPDRCHNGFGNSFFFLLLVLYLKMNPRFCVRVCVRYV